MPISQPTSTFGRTKAPHTIIIARGERVRHFTIRPWALGALAGAATLLSTALLGSAGYLLLSDDLMAVAVTRQENLSRAYEERIAALRSQLDHVTTRQMLARETVETKVDTLLDQQEELAERYERLAPMFEKARSSGLLGDGETSGTEPEAATPRVLRSGDAAALLTPAASTLAFAPSPFADVADRFSLIDNGRDGAELDAPEAMPLLRAAGDRSIPSVIDEIEQSMRLAATEQQAQAQRLADDARRRSTLIADTLRTAGIDILDEEPAAALGGPFEPVPAGFDAAVEHLDEALTALQRVSEQAAALPLAAPLKNAARSSGFGVRRDPFLGRSALHAGLDFAAPAGTAIRATAPGKVAEAGVSGGYGRMVEVDHGGGLTTRFAHMSEIAVSAGDTVEAGTVIGYVGSTGRSTGPHLHYEIRRDGVAMNPDRFLKAGRAIARLG